MWNQPEKITNKDKILEICRSIMGTKKFLYALYDKNENCIHEGPGIMGISSGDEGVRLTLTNSDSNYCSPSGFVMLEDIEYIQEVN